MEKKTNRVVLTEDERKRLIEISNLKSQKTKRAKIVLMLESDPECMDKEFAERLRVSKNHIGKTRCEFLQRRMAMFKNSNNLQSQEEKIIELYHAGLSAPKIACVVGCTETPIYSLLKKHNLKTKCDRRGPFPEKEERMIELCQKGLGITEISNEISYSRCTIRHHLKKIGLKAKNKQGIPKVQPDKIIELHHAGLSSKEIAKKMNLSVSTIVIYKRKLDLNKQIKDQEIESMDKIIFSNEEINFVDHSLDLKDEDLTWKIESIKGHVSPNLEEKEGRNHYKRMLKNDPRFQMSFYNVRFAETEEDARLAIVLYTQEIKKFLIKYMKDSAKLREEERRELRELQKKKESMQNKTINF